MSVQSPLHCQSPGQRITSETLCTKPSSFSFHQLSTRCAIECCHALSSNLSAIPHVIYGSVAQLAYIQHVLGISSDCSLLIPADVDILCTSNDFTSLMCALKSVIFDTLTRLKVAHFVEIIQTSLAPTGSPQSCCHDAVTKPWLCSMNCCCNSYASLQLMDRTTAQFVTVVDVTVLLDHCHFPPNLHVPIHYPFSSVHSEPFLISILAPEQLACSAIVGALRARHTSKAHARLRMLSCFESQQGCFGPFSTAAHYLSTETKISCPCDIPFFELPPILLLRMKSVVPFVSTTPSKSFSEAKFEEQRSQHRIVVWWRQLVLRNRKRRLSLSFTSWRFFVLLKRQLRSQTIKTSALIARRKQVLIRQFCRRAQFKLTLRFLCKWRSFTRLQHRLRGLKKLITNLAKKRALMHGFSTWRGFQTTKSLTSTTVATSKKPSRKKRKSRKRTTTVVIPMAGTLEPVQTSSASEEKSATPVVPHPVVEAEMRIALLERLMPSFAAMTSTTFQDRVAVMLRAAGEWPAVRFATQNYSVGEPVSYFSRIAAWCLTRTGMRIPEDYIPPKAECSVTTVIRETLMACEKSKESDQNVASNIYSKLYRDTAIQAITKLVAAWRSLANRRDASFRDRLCSKMSYVLSAAYRDAPCFLTVDASESLPKDLPDAIRFGLEMASSCNAYVSAHIQLSGTQASYAHRVLHAKDLDLSEFFVPTEQGAAGLDNLCGPRDASVPFQKFFDYLKSMRVHIPGPDITRALYEAANTV